MTKSLRLLIGEDSPDDSVVEVRELEVRRERRREQEHRRFLAEVSALLIGDRDCQAILDKVAGLVVSQLADWCLIALDAFQPSDRLVSVIHRDPARRALAARL